MKKILALALALVFALALAVPTFAAATTNDTTSLVENKAYDVDLAGTSNSANQTVIQYDVEGNYEITIPALIELKSEQTIDAGGTEHTPEIFATQTATITAKKVIIEYDYEFVVAMAGSSTQDSTAFTISTPGQTIAYTVKKGNVTISPSAGIAKFYDDAKANKDVLLLQEGGKRNAQEDEGGYIMGTGTEEAGVSVELTFTANSLPKYQAQYSGRITFYAGVRSIHETAPADPT